jgi:clan AA aspartic protease (TIGR02281 family)
MMLNGSEYDINARNTTQQQIACCTKLVIITGANSMRAIFFFIAVFMLCLFACKTAIAEIRTWTTNDGKHTLEAESVSFDGEEVRLKKSSGKVITISASKLCQADRKYLTKYHAEKIAKLALEKLGIRVSSQGLGMHDDKKLSKAFRDIGKVRRDLINSSKVLTVEEQKITAIRNHIDGLILLDQRLNAQLANLGSNDIIKNNKLVGGIKANQSQVQLFRSKLDYQEKNIDAARVQANDKREAYLQAILNMRKLADVISAQYSSKASNPDVKKALAEWNRATGKSYELTGSHSFQRTVRLLESLEKTVLSESIPLRKASGGTLYVSVVINGHAVEMTFDTGASLICLPKSVATECGIEVGPRDRPISLSVADGRKITGHLVTISSVRVGKFSEEDVECAVLSEESAPPLLGMSFLSNYKIEINAQGRRVTMLRVETETAPSSQRNR